MALKMAQPWKDPASGTYHLRQRTPLDLVAAAKGQTVSLPVGEAVVAVKVGSIVQVSLRTKDVHEAKLRHAAADAALKTHWAALRNGPQALTHRQAVALAGWVYRAAKGVFENEPHFSRRFIQLEESRRAFEAEAIRNGTPAADAEVELIETSAVFGHDVRALSDDPAIATPEALEAMFGKLADKLVRGKGLIIDGDSRILLLKEMKRAYALFIEDTSRAADGDYSDSGISNRFPSWAGQSGQNGTSTSLTMKDLIERWSEKQRPHLSPTTIDRYLPSLRSFASFIGEKRISLVTGDDVYQWAENRRDVDGVSARTVNNNDLVALGSVMNWACRHHGGRVIAANPARGIQLQLPRPAGGRDRTFHHDEIARILRAASEATVRGHDVKLLAAKRWCPWLAAYTGARIFECTSIRGQDVRQEDKIWLVELIRTKGGKPRRVPLHGHLIELGFLEFVRQAGPGALFHDAPVRNFKTHPADLRAEYLARWVREAAKLDDYGVAPNHGWRHTFKTRLLEVGVPERISDAITGHTSKGVARAYEAPTVEMMAAAIGKMPRYRV